MPAVPAGNHAPSLDPSARIGAPSLSRVPVLEAEESRYYDNLTKIAIIVHLYYIFRGEENFGFK